MVKKDSIRSMWVNPGFRDGHGAAEFERLFCESYQKVYNYVCYRMSGSEGVDDVVAEAFCKAARSFSRFDADRAQFSTWVIAIARNCLSDYWKANRPASPIDEVDESILAAEDEYPSFDDSAGRQELLQRLLSVLNDEERELVYLRYYEGKRNVEIARELGMNASTVATKIQRALKKMRAVNEGSGD